MYNITWWLMQSSLGVKMFHLWSDQSMYVSWNIWLLSDLIIWRDIIRNAVNASESDSVIFVGSGVTGAIHKLIHALDFKEPPVSTQFTALPYHLHWFLKREDIQPTPMQRCVEFISLMSSSETQGQIVGVREILNEWENMAWRKLKNGEKSPWGPCLTRPVPNGRRRSAFWLGRKTQFSGTNQKSERHRSLLFFVPYFPTRLDLPLPPLSAPGSLRIICLMLDSCKFPFMQCTYIYFYSVPLG